MFCKTCNYALRDIAEHRCPECGAQFDPADPSTYRHSRFRIGFGWESFAGLAAFGVLCLLSGRQPRVTFDELVMCLQVITLVFWLGLSVSAIRRGGLANLVLGGVSLCCSLTPIALRILHSLYFWLAPTLDLSPMDSPFLKVRNFLW